MTAATIGVSIVIPTRDAAAHLARCLESIGAQRGGVTAEAIVVDQGSTEGTVEVASAGGATVVTMPRSPVYTPPTASRNAGAAAARGTFLLHLDADMTLVPDTLARAVESCASEGHVALVLEELDVAEGFWASCKALERRAYRGTAIEGARFVRADIFRAVRGYDEALGSGEDWDVHARYAGHGSIGRIERAVHHHLGAVSLGGQLAKKFSYGRTAAAFMEKHESHSLAGEMLKAYARSWPSFARDPLHALGFVSLRAAEAVAVAAGVGIAALERRKARSRPT